MLKILLLTLITSSLSAATPLNQDYIKAFKAGLEQHEKAAYEYTPKKNNYDFNQLNETAAIPDSIDYDFIIIGAGAAGLVIANRLSEVPEWKILLLEAGGPETPYTKIPRYDYLLPRTDFNWGFKTVPQKNWCLGMVDHQCAIAAGKALGGSTAINGMLYTRGNPRDYDMWDDLGNDGWCYNDVLPYFKKAENADLEYFDPTYHNQGGRFHIENPQYTTKITKHTLEAAKELGLNIVDYNGKEQLGLGRAQLNTKHGRRQSTAEAYLKPASGRRNLIIKPFSHVTKVLINQQSKEAEGVLYLQEGNLLCVKAKKEVIVSGGTFNTPKILMLSGVGPKEELQRLNISCIQNLKVGHNFKNHIGFFGLDYIYNGSLEHESNSTIDDVTDYLQNGKGKLTTNGFETVGYLQTKNSKPTSIKYPDIEIFFFDSEISSSSYFNQSRFKEEVFTSLYKSVDNQKAINVGVMLAHPKSTGIVTLKDKNPFEEPIIDPNQLSDPDNEDLNTLVGGIRQVIKLMNTKAMQKLNTILNDTPLAGCESFTWGSDPYWSCAVRHMSISFRHQTGTSKMGPNTDPNAVVDNKLKVYGLKKLRVADASVIPITITGHTMAPTIMIGEKASDLIKETWQ